MNKVNVIRHLAFEDLGSFAAVFEQQGFPVRYFEAGIDDLGLLDVDDDLLVILGGPISVNDVDDFPFLRKEVELVRKRIMQDKPVLGICLGAQIIARAAGAGVSPARQKEIGWSQLELSAAGEHSALRELAISQFNVLHWHGETFELPKGATLLASTAMTPNQAFSIGNNVLGLQFHVEVSDVDLERWFIGHIGEITQTPGISVYSLRSQTMQVAAHAAESGRAFLRNWLSSIIS